MRKIIVLILLATFQAKAERGFELIPKNSNKKSDVVEVTLMPEIRSQDSLGNCYSFSAATLIEQSICKEKPELCKTPEARNELRTSTLALSKYVGDSSGIDASNANSYPKRIDNGLTFGSDILQNILRVGKISKDKCAPFDRFVSKASTPEAQAREENALWKQFSESYNLMKKEFKGCEECILKDISAQKHAEDMIQKFSLKTSPNEVLKSFASKTYGEFLYKVLVPENCTSLPSNRITFSNQLREVKVWPEENTSERNYDSAIAKIKEKLRQNIPIMVDRFCTLPTISAECAMHSPAGVEAGSHSFVISGFRKMCDKENQNCYDAVRVHNSWGQTWQEKNDDGWVDAKEIIARTQFQYASLAWLEPKK